MSTTPLKIVVNGAAGQIGYSILQPIACGLAFGMEQPIHIVLFDLPQCENILKGIQIELEDLASPILMGTTVVTSVEEAFKDADFVVCIASAVLSNKMASRAEFGDANKKIYEEQGKLLEKYAKKTVRVLVVANPCNSMCYVIAANAPSIPKENFSSMSRLDYDRAKSMLALKFGVSTKFVNKVIIWGNHSPTMVPDFSSCVVTTKDGKTEKVLDLIKDEKYWTDIIPAIQGRGYEVVKMRQKSSALSSAIGAVHHLRDWYCGTPEGDFSIMGVYSDGSYGAPEGVYFCFPCICKNGKWEIVKGLTITDDIKANLKITGDELLKEKQDFGF